MNLNIENKTHGSVPQNKTKLTSIMSPKNKKISVGSVQDSDLSPKPAQVKFADNVPNFKSSSKKKSLNKSFVDSPGKFGNLVRMDDDSDSLEDQMMQNGDISSLFQTDEKKDSRQENRLLKETMSPIPRKQTMAQRAASQDHVLKQKIKTAQNNPNNNIRLGMKIEKQKRRSIHNDNTQHQQSATERAKSEQINVSIRQDHSKSTIVGFGLKARQTRVNDSPIIKKTSFIQDDEPNVIYDEQFQNTVGVSATMKKYIESSSQNLKPKKINSSQHAYTNNSVRNNAQMFNIQDADQIIQESNQNKGGIKASLTNLSKQKSKNTPIIKRENRDNENSKGKLIKMRTINGKLVYIEDKEDKQSAMMGSHYSAQSFLPPIQKEQKGMLHQSPSPGRKGYTQLIDTSKDSGKIIDESTLQSVRALRQKNINIKIGEQDIQMTKTDTNQILINQSLVKLLQKKCTEMAKLADTEVNVRGQVEQQLSKTVHEKELISKNNRVLNERCIQIQEKQEQTEKQLITVKQEKKKLEVVVKQKEQQIEIQNKSIQGLQNENKKKIRTNTKRTISPDKKESAINFNPEGPMTSDEVIKLQEELNQMRNESRQIKQRLTQETASRKNWQEISRKKDEEVNLFRQQMISLSKEIEQEKINHQRTQNGLNLKIERLKIMEIENNRLQRMNQSDFRPTESPSRRMHKTKNQRESYEQARFTIGEKDLDKLGKKDLLNQMKNGNKVPFPERSPNRGQQYATADQTVNQKDVKEMSRIELLKNGFGGTKVEFDIDGDESKTKSQVKGTLNQSQSKKKVAFQDTTDDLD